MLYDATISYYKTHTKVELKRVDKDIINLLMVQKMYRTGSLVWDILLVIIINI